MDKIQCSCDGDCDAIPSIAHHVELYWSTEKRGVAVEAVSQYLGFLLEDSAWRSRGRQALMTDA
jgi:hypothetical protein